MSELLEVYFLTSDIRTCFFYLNDTDLRNCRSSKQGIRISYGDNHSNLTYGSISFTPLSEVPNNCIGVPPLYANKLGLKENEPVLVSHCDTDSINTLQIIPKKEEDYIILLRCKTILETHMLNQVCVVTENQTLPLYVFSNISIDVEIGKVDTKQGYGQLEKFTEIIVLHPSEKQYLIKSGINKSKDVTGNPLDGMISHLNKSLKGKNNLGDILAEKEALVRDLINNNKKINNLEYKIQPSFMVKNEIQRGLLGRFILLSNFTDVKNTFGPFCIKLIAKVEKVRNKKKKSHLGTDDSETDVKEESEEEEKVSLYAPVISLNNDTTMTAFCPPYVMKKLNVYIGSRISVTKINPSANIPLLDHIKETNFVKKQYFWQSMADIRESTRETIFNNFMCNYKLNTLIVGGPGTGKSFLLMDLTREFLGEFFFCQFVHCKSLRGKKIETLQKLINENLRECACHDPSLLILDDLHALTYGDDEEGEFNRFYSYRVVDLITEGVKEFQGRHNISVIATSKDVTKLSSIVSTHGPRLFQIVHKIPEISSPERSKILENIFYVDPRTLDFEKLVNATNGYTIQDLNDLVDKAVFNCLLRNEFPRDLLRFTQVDFDTALAELVPMSLRDVKLKEDVVMKWEEVGGMTEPKKILTEVFSWPTKYPKLVESCPLRLQRGVLLYGAPGTGKTLLAGALANQCGLNFISVKGPELLSKYVGASEEGVRNLFLQAQKTQPCLLFFDEFDSLAPKRGHDNTGVTDRVVNQLLTQLDGVEALNGVWVLAATSRPDMIDPALLRPGRLDKLVLCGVPNQTDRLSILEALSQNLPKGEDVDLAEISEKSEGYTGADLQAILYNAQMSAIKERKNDLEKGFQLKITQNHLLAALSETKPSLSHSEILRYERMYERFLDSRKKNSPSNYTMPQKVTLA